LTHRSIPEKARNVAGRWFGKSVNSQPEDSERKVLADDLRVPMIENRVRRKKRKRARRWTLLPPKGAALKQSRAHSTDQTKQKAQSEDSRSDLVESLYVAIWDRVFRAISRAVVDHRTENWPEYFNEVRGLTCKAVAEGTTSGLSANQKTELVRRLVERINGLEKWWPSSAKDTDGAEPTRSV
jgi:hypothetical protein